MKLLIVSFDALGDTWLDRVSRRPETARFLQSAALYRGARSVFVTNTYPVHASVVTGLPPAGHGLIANEDAFPARRGKWNFETARIKASTIIREAHAAGLTTAAVLWPVTGGEAALDWNFPEIVPWHGAHIVREYLRWGTKSVILGGLVRHAFALRGLNQPALDNFSTAVAVDILKKRRPDLMLVHFTAFDTLCHRFGYDFDALEPALAALNRNFASLLAVADGDADDPYAVVIFSDHSQLAVRKTLCLNDLLVERGLLGKKAGVYIPGASGCFVECCGGTAYFHRGALDSQTVRQALDLFARSEGFNRFLTEDEMTETGRRASCMSGEETGFCAKPGYEYEAFCPPGKSAKHAATHGYPISAEYPDYDVWYAVRGPDFAPGTVWQGGEAHPFSLLDIAPIARRLLGLPA
jgi:predicted AlkP superfamily pyrophosphatase or phosphodiesterase